MDIKEVKSQFSKVTSVSQYVRVSDTHPLELYVGLNEQGQKTLRFNGVFTPNKVFGTKNMEVKQYKFNDYLSILFSNNTEENESLFYKFCEDIINFTEKSSVSSGYSDLLNRYSLWKKFFSQKSNILSEPEIIGLIGELLFLKDYSFMLYGISNGLLGWSGPEPTHKDFSYDRDWFEIKTIGNSSKTVKISSLEQLDSNDDGYLILYRLEKMSANFSGISLNKLIDEIKEIIVLDSDKDLFEEKLLKVGYSYNEIYDTYVYNLIARNKYLVNNEFPRISGISLPKGIVKLTYEIEISSILKLEVK